MTDLDFEPGSQSLKTNRKASGQRSLQCYTQRLCPSLLQQTRALCSLERIPYSKHATKSYLKSLGGIQRHKSDSHKPY